MSSKCKITFTGPFPFCEECKYADIETHGFYNIDGEEYLRTRSCSRDPICTNAVNGYKELLKARANRPYDAFGDDEGRG